jgi:hypothetical protein
MDWLIKLNDFPITWVAETDYENFKTKYELLEKMLEKASFLGIFDDEEMNFLKKEMFIMGIAMTIASFGVFKLGSNESDIISRFSKLATFRQQFPSPIDSIDERIIIIKELQKFDTIRFNERTIDCNTRWVDLDAIYSYVSY